MISRFRKGLESTNMSIDNRLRLMADFKIAVVESVLEPKWVKDDNKRSLEEIAKYFASRVSDLIEGRFDIDKATTATDDKKEQSDSCMGAFVQYSDGQVSGVEETSLAAQGFKIGDVVKHKKADLWTYFKIKSLGKNTVELNPFNTFTGALNHSELQQVDMDVFSKNWTHHKKQIEEHDGVEIKLSDLDASIFKAMVVSCMGELLKLDRSSVRVFKSPESAVFSLKACDPEELMIPPVTTNISAAKADNHDGKNIMVNLEGQTIKLAPQKDSECMHAFWFLDVKDDVTKCNLQLVDKIFYTKRPSVKNPNTNTVIPVTIPVAVNFKPIAEHDRLVLHRPAVQKKTENKREAALILSSSDKKAKK